MKKEYEKPELNVIVVQVERGFAGSNLESQASFDDFGFVDDGSNENTGM